MDNNASKELLQSLVKANVEAIHIMCASPTLNKDYVDELNEFAAGIWPEKYSPKRWTFVTQDTLSCNDAKWNW